MGISRHLGMTYSFSLVFGFLSKRSSLTLERNGGNLAITPKKAPCAELNEGNWSFFQVRPPIQKVASLANNEKFNFSHWDTRRYPGNLQKEGSKSFRHVRIRLVFFSLAKSNAEVTREKNNSSEIVFRIITSGQRPLSIFLSIRGKKTGNVC